MVALIMAIIIFALPVVSCSSSGKKMMELSGVSVPVNMYEFFLSRQKGTLTTTYYYGSDAKKDEFWNTTISSDGTTYNDFWTSYILQSMKIYLAALYLFEKEYNLTLPGDAVDAVDEKLTELLDYDADGSKSAFNAILAQYGINYNMLREIYLLEAKISYLQEYIYGSGLTKVSDEVKEEYYQENYVRFKQVFFANYNYIYEADENGDTIYFDPNSEDGKILYDSSTGIRKFDVDGKALTDKHGKVIYYHEDYSIAYDEVNGIPSYVYDENGQYKTALYNKDELEKIQKNAEEIIEFTQAGDTKSFEKLIDQYSEEETKPNGYYFHSASKYSYEYINDIVAVLGEMQIGDMEIVESDYGYHVIMKYSLDEGGYAADDNEEWFEDFSTGVVQWLFTKKCEEYTGSIVIDEEIAAGISMIDVLPNYNY